MGKYLKYALVLLYVLQLVIVFRDQLADLYRKALEARKDPQADTASREWGLRSVLERVVRIARPASPMTIQAVADALPSLIIDADGADDHIVHDDDYKDKGKRFKRRILRHFLIRNLFLSLRRHPPGPNGSGFRGSDMLRTITFPANRAAAA